MGRMAAHTGQVITYDQILNNDHEFAPNVDKLTMDSPAPLVAGPDGSIPSRNPASPRNGNTEDPFLTERLDNLCRHALRCSGRATRQEGSVGSRPEMGRVAAVRGSEGSKGFETWLSAK